MLLGERDREQRRGENEVRGQRASGEVKGEEGERTVKQAQDKEGRRRKPFFFFSFSRCQRFRNVVTLVCSRIYEGAFLCNGKCAVF